MDQATMDEARKLAGMAAGEQGMLFPKGEAEAPGDPQANPAERPGRTSAERQRIPMSVPVQRLSVPKIPGYHLHWFRGTPDRILRAQQAGYEFVESHEVQLNSTLLGSDSAESGNMSLGDRVMVAAGSEVTVDNQPVQMVLMKLKEEFWVQDQMLLEDRNEEIAATIRGGKVAAGQAGAENPYDVSQRYTRGTQNLFSRKPKR